MNKTCTYFRKKDIQEVSKSINKALNIINPQKNANGNLKEIPIHTCKDGEKTDKPNFGELCSNQNAHPLLMEM